MKNTKSKSKPSPETQSASGNDSSSSSCSPKIIQILIAPNDSTWQGILLGLGDDGITYQVGTGTKWEPMIRHLGFKENAKVRGGGG